ncbi:CPBP family intramembrane glutamic endopeptidase [Candidatus Villigracilis affinis]|uniref:CPBP family intramembrane glutamic endopeptidase n=1 Tax=Candidatus Villigracilis affinis TaxID=3140682 RepID=UPI002A19DFF2|nr:CPBP family intramembrane metalloprotease [Anaerolineales bacterium]
MTVALGCIYGLAMLFFTIAFLVEWIKSRNEIKKYLKYGAWFGFTVIGLDLFIVAITPSAWSPSLLVALIAEPIVLLRIIGFTMLGMYYAAELGYPSLPILLKKFKIPAVEEKLNPVAEIEKTETSQEYQDSDLSSTQADNVAVKPPVIDLLISINWKEYFIKVLGVSAVSIIYSIILFLLTKPHMSELAQQKFGTPSANLANAITIQGILVLFEFAIAEELVFRLGIQNFLVKYLNLQNNNYWIAIVITSVLWTLGHAGVLEPEWVKLAQIFPVGLLFGWLYKKLGAESTILAHGIFNLVLVFLSTNLIK